jgi:hypothetical protein
MLTPAFLPVPSEWRYGTEDARWSCWQGGAWSWTRTRTGTLDCNLGYQATHRYILLRTCGARGCDSDRVGGCCTRLALCTTFFARSMSTIRQLKQAARETVSKKSCKEGSKVLSTSFSNKNHSLLGRFRTRQSFGGTCRYQHIRYRKQSKILRGIPSLASVDWNLLTSIAWGCLIIEIADYVRSGGHAKSRGDETAPTRAVYTTDTRVRTKRDPKSVEVINGICHAFTTTLASTHYQSLLLQLYQHIDTLLLLGSICLRLLLLAIDNLLRRLLRFSGKKVTNHALSSTLVGGILYTTLDDLTYTVSRSLKRTTYR